MPYANRFQNAITFEISTEEKRFIRSTYSIIDFLAELGGVVSAVTPTCIGILTFFQFQGAQNYLMADLFYNTRGGRN